MKRVTIEEFRQHLDRHLYGELPIEVIDEQGRLVGYYTPDAAARQRGRQAAVDRLSAAIDRILARTGMTEDECARFFDTTKPIPDEAELAAIRANAERHGSDR